MNHLCYIAIVADTRYVELIDSNDQWRTISTELHIDTSSLINVVYTCEFDVTRLGRNGAEGGCLIYKFLIMKETILPQYYQLFAIYFPERACILVIFLILT